MYDSWELLYYTKAYRTLHALCITYISVYAMYNTDRVHMYTQEYFNHLNEQCNTCIQSNVFIH